MREQPQLHGLQAGHHDEAAAAGIATGHGVFASHSSRVRRLLTAIASQLVPVALLSSSWQ